ncbi:MAG: aminotransferase class V-fold PLP-dependent enzyme, partial [Rhodothermales bacterium]
NGRAARWNDRILEAIDDSTDVVALPHVHWTDGTRFDLVAISDRARDVDAALVIDGTQSVGALAFNVRQVRPDALICAGYKWLHGPYALGVAYLDERHHGGSPLEENWIGRLGSEQFSRLVNYEDRYQPGAVRFDVGERSNFILVPMLAAALELVLEWGPNDLQTYCEHLCRPLVERARELGYEIEPPQGRGHHLFGLRRADGIDQERLRQELARKNVSVSVRGTAVRVAPHVYNDDRDVDALIDALEAASRAYT